MYNSQDSQTLELRDIRFSYGKTSLFEGLNVRFRPGEVTGIIGPNGCGKSTLLMIASGLLRPDEGEALVNGIPLHRMSHRQRAGVVSLMPQDTAAVYMSVKELVTLGRYSHLGMFQQPTPEDQRIIEEALAITGIDGLSERSVDSLSGGQRQRAYIAMMIAQQAKIALLDEPTSALDIGASHDVLRLVRSIQEQNGQTTIIVLHDIDLALRYCDRIVVMDGGAIMQVGSPDAVAFGPALPDAFNVSVHCLDTPAGRSWTFFPR